MDFPQAFEKRRSEWSWRLMKSIYVLRASSQNISTLNLFEANFQINIKASKEQLHTTRNVLFREQESDIFELVSYSVLGGTFDLGSLNWGNCSHGADKSNFLNS